MGFFYKKKFKLAKGLDLNLSKNGIGVSGGVKGFKISKNSKGETYLNTGKKGFYYRENLDSNKSTKDENIETTTIIYAIIFLTVLTYFIACFISYNLGYGFFKILKTAIITAFFTPIILTILYAFYNKKGN